MQEKLVLSFLDRVAPKNRLQINILHELGYRIAFFVNSYHTAAESYFTDKDFYQPLKPGLLTRIFQIFSFFLKYHKEIHHLEVYPGGRFAFVYILLAKIFGLRVICVERGDLCYLISGGYDKLTRLSMRLCYRLSDLIWYREVYMNTVLQEMGYEHKLFFLHNAVETEREDININRSFSERDIDFLWLNRLTPERRSDWLVHILSGELFKNTFNVLAGFLSNTLYNADQEYVQQNRPPNLHLEPFIENPTDLYKRARYFILPAEFVFANNALLEAMSYGIVPLIVNKSGFELLVQDGVSGFVSDYTEEAFKEIMEKAVALDAVAFEQMSEAARKHVLTVFSRGAYKQKLVKLYKLIQI